MTCAGCAPTLQAAVRPAERGGHIQGPSEHSAAGEEPPLRDHHGGHPQHHTADVGRAVRAAGAAEGPQQAGECARAEGGAPAGRGSRGACCSGAARCSWRCTAAGATAPCRCWRCVCWRTTTGTATRSSPPCILRNPHRRHLIQSTGSCSTIRCNNIMSVMLTIVVNDDVNIHAPHTMSVVCGEKEKD